MNKNTSGFTIVELLIVIVVIAILAAISIVAYTNIQQRARDAQREQDIAQIVKALELYYIEEGEYPDSGGATVPNASWSNSSDPTSWQYLINQLSPYVSTLPVDPTNVGVDEFTYTYYANMGSRPLYCGASGNGQMYMLRYRLESGTAKQNTVGDCSTDPLNYSRSYHRVVK